MESASSFPVIDWSAGLASLNVVLPNAISFDADHLSEQIAQKVGSQVWQKIAGWDDLTDHEIREQTVRLLPRNATGIIACNRISYFVNGLFLVSADFLFHSIESFQRIYKEQFFSGDTMLYSPQDRYLYILHHEGAYVEILFPLS